MQPDINILRRPRIRQGSRKCDWVSKWPGLFDLRESHPPVVRMGWSDRRIAKSKNRPKSEEGREEDGVVGASGKFW